MDYSYMSKKELIDENEKKDDQINFLERIIKNHLLTTLYKRGLRGISRRRGGLYVDDAGTRGTPPDPSGGLRGGDRRYDD